MPMPSLAPAPRPETAATAPAYFPIFLDLRAAPVLVVGGGEEALAKVEALRRADAQVAVVAENACAGIEALAISKSIELHRRGFEAADLAGARLCIVADEDDEAAARVAAAAREQGVTVNAADRPSLCDFIMPAVVERGPVRIAISTGGLSPALARHLRLRIEAMLPASYGRLAEFCGRWRRRVATRLRDASARRRFWGAVVAGAEAHAVLAGDPERAEQLMAARLDGAGQVVTLRSPAHIDDRPMPRT